MSANPATYPAARGDTTTADLSPDLDVPDLDVPGGDFPGGDEAGGLIPVIATLVALRKALGLSQRDVAALTGINQSTISNLESGRIEPRISTLARYAAGCGGDIEIAVSLSDGVTLPDGAEWPPH